MQGGAILLREHVLDVRLDSDDCRLVRLQPLQLTPEPPPRLDATPDEIAESLSLNSNLVREPKDGVVSRRKRLNDRLGHVFREGPKKLFPRVSNESGQLFHSGRCFQVFPLQMAPTVTS